MKVTCLALLMVALSASCATLCAAAELLSPSTWFGGGSGKTTLSSKPNSKSSLLKAPPVVGKMTNGTKRLLSSPTSIFKPKTKPKPVKKSGTTKVTKAKRTEPEKEGFFKSILNPEPPPPPKTIKEWMALEQIHP